MAKIMKFIDIFKAFSFDKKEKISKKFCNFALEIK